MSFTFVKSRHALHQSDIMEVFLDGRFVAALYADDSEETLKLVSSHLNRKKHPGAGVQTFRFDFSENT